MYLMLSGIFIYPAKDTASCNTERCWFLFLFDSQDVLSICWDWV